MSDFSEKHIKKKVSSEILQHPLSLFPLTVGVLGLFAFFLGLIEGSAFFYTLVTFCGLGIFAYIINFMQKQKFESRYISLLNKKIEEEKLLKIDRLKKKLSDLCKNTELVLYAEQAQLQFDKVKTKFNNFKEMLHEKLNASEITYGRFLGTSEQVYLAVLDNLEKVVHSLDLMNSIDPKYIKTRLDHLESLSDPEAADLAEIKTMNKRKQLREKQREAVNKLLTYNEEAMTEIDTSMSSIASAQTNPDRASVDMEFARAELARLAERTKNFKS